MIVYQSGRQAGKTQSMIEWYLREPETRNIVVMSHAEGELLKQRIHKQSNVAKIVLDAHIIPVHRVIEGKTLGMKQGEVGIDNLDRVLSYIFHQPVDFVTIGTDDNG